MLVTGGVGARVAEERKLGGLTQHQLATRASVSVSLIRAVEQGRAPASPAFVSAVARALGIGVAELLDQPFARANQGERKLHSVVPALRREMAAYLLSPGEEVPRRSLDTQRAAGTNWRCCVATTGELITSGEFAGARGYLERSRATIEDRLGHADAPTLSMWGSLHLKSALAAARADDRDGADDHLAEVRDTAEWIGTDRDDYRMCFGPTNVAI
jgi:transcriptional regulator with XRE-family HTH domain